MLSKYLSFQEKLSSIEMITKTKFEQLQHHQISQTQPLGVILWLWFIIKSEQIDHVLVS